MKICFLRLLRKIIVTRSASLAGPVLRGIFFFLHIDSISRKLRRSPSVLVTCSINPAFSSLS